MNDIIKEKLSALPTSSGVYLMKNKGGQVIYVGKAKNLKNRVSQYFNASKKEIKVKAMVENVFDLDYFVTLNELDALALESNLIKKYMPYYNILLKDGKAFSYIKVNLKDEYPKFEVTRKLKKDGAKYFGPYVSGVTANELLKTINLAFLLKTNEMSDQKELSKEYINYFIGIGGFKKNNLPKEEYKKIVNQTLDFLSGKDEEFERLLKQKMQKYAESENFEQALILRDRLKMIEKMKERTITSMPKFLELDVFAVESEGDFIALSVIVCRGGKILGIQNYNLLDALVEKENLLSSFILQYYENTLVPPEILVDEDFEYLSETEEILRQRRGGAVSIVKPVKGYKTKLIEMAKENAKLYIKNSLTKEKQKYASTIGALYKLQEELKLKNFPARIECYDISNLSGTNTVASMVVFENGEPKRKAYRKFKINSVEGPNDFESLKEALSRRLERLKNNDEVFGAKPDLIIIDGGKGQLSSVKEIFDRFEIKDIDLISLAKQFEEVYLPHNSIPIMLKRNSYELKLIQRIRDETHRFAITYHRLLRGKSALKSALDGIKGLGPKKKMLLFLEFKTVEKIKNSTIEELTKVKGITPELAKSILEKLNE